MIRACYFFYRKIFFDKTFFNKFALTTIVSSLTVLFLISPNLAMNHVQAQSSSPDLDLTVFPPVAYLMVKPGKEISHTVLLEYKGTVAIEITPQLVDFTTDGLTGQPVLQQPSQISYITLRTQTGTLPFGQPITLAPNSQLQLTAQISPPIRAKTGEFPLSLILTATPQTTVVTNGVSTQASGGIASNIILSVQDDLDNHGQLEVETITIQTLFTRLFPWIQNVFAWFSSSKVSILKTLSSLPTPVDSFSHIQANIVARNNGRNAIAAGGTVILSHNWSNKQLRQWYIYPDVVLADASRSLRGLFTDPDDLEPNQQPEFVLFSYKPVFLLGSYQLNVQLYSGTDQNSPHHETVEVFAFPFSILLLLLVGTGLYFGYHRWEKQHSDQTQGPDGY